MLALLLGAAAPAWATPDAGGQELTAYVRARAAAASGNVDVAAAGYAAALRAVPGSEVVAVRAYRQALASGDLALAGRAAAVLGRSNVAPADTAVIAVAAALRDGDRTGAEAAVDAIGKGPLDFLAPVLKAWLAVESGVGDPLAPVDAAELTPLGRRYAGENRALLLIATGREAEGIAAMRALLGSDAGNLDVRRSAAELLAARGRDETARALLVGRDPLLAAVREGLKQGTPGTARWGAARLFARVAADLSRENLQPLQIALTRAALALDPQDGRAMLLLAGALGRDGAVAQGLATLDRAEALPGYDAAVEAGRVALLADAGEPARALTAARNLAASRSADADDWQRYGDLLLDAGRASDAAAAYGEAIARAGGAARWTLYLQRGGALEQAGQWAAALPDLKRAVALAPDEPQALNYLGYAQIERGENVAAARAMLEQAARLKPGDLAITDSLGWAYLRTGAVDRAVPLLETAARGEPSDVAINEHLGDAYWQSGRRYEARYAWRAAAVHAGAADAARLAGKLAGGPTPEL